MPKNTRFASCLVGLAVGSSRCNDAHVPGEHAKMAEIVTKALMASRPSQHLSEDIEAGDLPQFSREMAKRLIEWSKDEEGNDKPSMQVRAACETLAAGMTPGMTEGAEVVARAVPVGLYFLDNVPKIIRFSVASSELTHRGESAGCAAAAAAILVSVAMSEAPMGTWAHELMMVMRGIDKRLDSCVDDAVALVANGKDPMSLDNLGSCHGIVTSSLGCCMLFPKDFSMAVETASHSSEATASLVGALMGARLGLGGIPSEWIKPAGKWIALAEELERVANASGILPEKKSEAKEKGKGQGDEEN